MTLHEASKTTQSDRSMFLVYRIRNIVTNDSYIGCCRSPKSRYNRIASHKTLLRNNKHCKATLQSDFNKYGEDSFEVIEIAAYDNRRDALDHEAIAIMRECPRYNECETMTYSPIDKLLTSSSWNSTTPRIMPESFSTTEEDNTIEKEYDIEKETDEE